MKRRAPLALVAALMAAAFAPSAAYPSDLEGCGLTTLDGRITFTDADGDGRPDPGEPLRCEPGPGLDGIVVRELAPAQPERVSTRTPLASWIGFADLQLADEESPLRGEWADKCGRGDNQLGSPISSSAWRPHETMNPHLINAHVKAANAIAANGSPVLDAPVDFAVTMGDLADNQQYNETRLFIDLFDGGKQVDPGSGLPTAGAEQGTFLDGRRYDGVQAQDPEGSGVPFPAKAAPPVNDSPDPREAMRLLDLAQQPFYAEGLHTGDGPMPWLAVPGNHDVKVQGTIPDDNKAWRDLVRRYAVGHTKLMELAPDYQARLCRAMVEQDQDAFAAVFQDIIANPYDSGTTKVVPADWRRLPLYRSDEAKEAGDEESCKALAATDPLHADEISELCESSWLEQLGSEQAPGFPAKHGLAPENRCTDGQEPARPLDRLCYAFERGPFLFIGLDTNPPEGLERGNIDLVQWEWLQRTLKANSTSYYNDDGELVPNPNGEDKLVVVLSHHTSTTMDNHGAISDGIKYTGQQPPADIPTEGGAKYGEDLVSLLQHYPNVILHASGHTHENRVWAHDDKGLGAGYWEVNTAAIADPPHQSRLFEVADNRDGTLSIFSLTFEGRVPADPRSLGWSDDATADDGINEDWLASFGREVGYFDPQADPGANGTAAHQNVELVLPAPFALSDDDPSTRLTYTGDRSGRVGNMATFAAALTDSSGDPLSGLTVSFERAGEVLSAVTDEAGVARVTTRVTGPPGSSTITVSFAGSGDYLSSTIQVPFVVTRGGKGG